MRIVVLGTVAALLAGCAPLTLGSKDNYLLYGKSNVSADDALGQLNQAVRTSRNFGCEPISVGGGTGLAGQPGASGPAGEGVFIAITQIPREFDVYAVVECPAGTPELLPATGGPVP